MSDNLSFKSKSSTTSTVQLIKDKFRSSSSKENKPQLSPGEKQAQRRAGRMDTQTIATWAALR